MRGLGDHLTIGERVAFYRRRRGLAQTALASLVGRTGDWLRKIETGRATLDRLSVIRDLADALDVHIGDLLGEPVLLSWSTESGHYTIPKLREALTDWRARLPHIPGSSDTFDLGSLTATLDQVWTDYQESRYGRVAARLPELVTATSSAVRAHTADAGRQARRLAASAHQLATVYLTKLGEHDLALLAAGRGLDLAHEADHSPTIAALYRSNAHALAAIGRYGQAADLIEYATGQLAPTLTRPDADGLDLSMVGMLWLVGGLAAARDGHRADSAAHLTEAVRIAERLGGDANYAHSAFGPTNVAIHRTAAAVELGDLARAVDLGLDLNTAAMPVERRARHAIEIARVLAITGHVDDAMTTLLAAERYAAEQIHHHVLSREIVRRAIRHRTTSTTSALDLAARMGVAEL